MSGYQILMKTDFFQWMFKKHSNIRFNWKSGGTEFFHALSWKVRQKWWSW